MMGDSYYEQKIDIATLAKQRIRQAYSENMKDLWKKKHENVRSQSPEMASALRLSSFLREKEIIMFPDDILAGYTQYYTEPLNIFDEAQMILASDNLVNDDAERMILEQLMKGYHMGLFAGVHGGHVIAGYNTVLKKGFGVLEEEAKSAIKNTNGEDLDFANAILTVIQSTEEYILRYADEARKLLMIEKNENNRKNLWQIADTCKWIAKNPPRGFFDAIQLLWLTHEIVTCEQVSGSLSLGRLDSLLYPYYQTDLNNNVLTPHKAYELIETLWIKFSCIKRGFQNVTLGGIGADGEYQVNEISFMCLKAAKTLRRDQPLISVRWHNNMPESFWKDIQELLEVGLGFPALFNDDIVIASKLRMGVSETDAVNYAIVGCVEPSIPAKEFSHTEGLRVNMTKVLTLMLNSGTCMVTGEIIPLKSGDSIQSVRSFQEFFNLYKQELQSFVELGIEGINIIDRHFVQLCPYPFLSATMQGCLEKSRDVTAGGTIYNFSSVNGCGMANAADSLDVIDKFVFKDKKITLNGLTEIMNRDFVGSEIFNKELIYGHNRYGNDQKDVDSLMKEITDTFCNEVERHTNPRGGLFQTGMYTVDLHAIMGELTEATPDGRHAGTALANGLSPSQGADKTGPTAIIKSITKLDHRRYGNGIVLDMKFSPVFFKKEENRQKLKFLLETYFSLGGMEAQINVVSKETLLKAQKAPKDYEDLIVRVSGFSAYFIDLDRTLQNEIIERTEYGNF
jgi:formate C-acetyltransferase